MAPAAPPPDWDKKAVVDRLRAHAKGSEPVAAQVFLHGDEDGGNLSEVAHKLVDAAASAVSDESKKAAIGHVSRLAKSFSLTAHPDVFAALARDPAVKSILPSEIDDIYPKPTRIVRE